MSSPMSQLHVEFLPFTLTKEEIKNPTKNPGVNVRILITHAKM